MEGTVKWYNRKKGFGFIIGEDDVEYFVHYSGLAQGTFIRDNDRVAFDAVETEKGKQAQNVTLLQKASEMEGAPQESFGDEEPQAPAEEQQEAPAEEQPAEEAQPEEVKQE